MDDSLRALERSVLAEPSDDAAACAFLTALSRAGTVELPAFEPTRHAGRLLLGPLLPREASRLRSIDPSVVPELDRTAGWVDAASERGPALYAATMRLRLLQLDHLAHEPGADHVFFAFHAAIDLDREVALERFQLVLASGEEAAADRVARLLAARDEPEIGRRLAALLLEFPAERRARLYRELAAGRVPIDAEARRSLRAAIAREAAPVRARAFEALRRGATLEELAHDRANGPPEVRAAAFEALLAPADGATADELLRHALADPMPEVRRKAVEVLARPEWIRHPRAGDWGMGRLLDLDRAVRHDALKLVRRIPLEPRALPRLRLIVEQSPPGIRPGLERLLEHHEKRAR